MKGYLWMTDFTPQREWIEGRGVILMLAFFFTEIGAGAYLVSLFLGFEVGGITGWLICALLGGGLHLAYLGKPVRAWRSMLRPRSSELSRGVIVMSLFLLLGALHLGLAVSSGGLDWGDVALPFKVVQAVLGFFVITHGFMTLNVMRGIPFWNSSALPVFSLASGLWVGAQAMTGPALASGESAMVLQVEPVMRWFLFSYSVLALSYLWNASHGVPAARKSLQVLIRGELSSVFYIGVLFLSFLAPIGITLMGVAYTDSLTAGWLAVRMLCVVIGDMAFRYCIFRAACYSPLIYTNTIISVPNK